MNLCWSTLCNIYNREARWPCKRHRSSPLTTSRRQLQVGGHHLGGNRVVRAAQLLERGQRGLAGRGAAAGVQRAVDGAQESSGRGARGGRVVGVWAMHSERTDWRKQKETEAHKLKQGAEALTSCGLAVTRTPGQGAAQNHRLRRWRKQRRRHVSHSSRAAAPPPGAATHHSTNWEAS